MKNLAVYNTLKGEHQTRITKTANITKYYIAYVAHRQNVNVLRSNISSVLPSLTFQFTFVDCRKDGITVS